MHLDSKLLKLFYQNLNEAYRSAKLIILSYPRISNFFPLEGDKLLVLDIDALDKIDAFRVRFCDLQDAIGHKVFRSLLILEMEEIGSNLDVLNQIDKRGLITSFENWQEIRNIRNLFIHDYPDTVDFKAKILTQAFKHIQELIDVLNRVIEYSKKFSNLEFSEFPSLKIT